MRHYNLLDTLLTSADNALRTLAGGYQTTPRSNPSHKVTNEKELDDAERRHVAGLMRINHCGEVCAQALYQGQAITARNEETRAKMELSAKEENDHLDWCKDRLTELNTHTSLLNPLWYASSFTIGAVAGLAGDQWSLGFVVETERQVVKHLESHLTQLPEHDHKSRAILEVMKEDEAHHATAALEAGGAALPQPIKAAMSAMSKVMTKTVYHI
ncbi:2-polyprenyl-3-methyl-6-methoxy-1,4-benzoquinone monooxygenase [Pleionea sp. CnH1-48]|uniref:2-polyprenyl-3-methyl-6-methoxy-1,4-benzoquinone monooxygenase n=1 Tax=Pleionea sp. CnH1-48 TaxID=2954494 RepID=UPI002097F19B|nr:2-polyprenyl-3-methyl-6-methoxy-1,4-benzoquinone monooxygenase [Pleionea sp. CnH1-48]MCO7224682.1 2-polyprenyl-3-methyl-6-methoxy-1,4-benzoquinone monooxygenase [Pleionea sp. CnH1-48]